jgi:4-methylaminobutanoate oxidase (formaldehyde-forming)
MEKAYRDYGHDIDNTDCPISVGLGFAVDFDSEFVGKEALLTRKLAGTPTERLVQVLVDDPAVQLFHGEVVLRDGVPVGDVRAASYGWTLGGAVGLAFVSADEPVTAAWLRDGTWTVDVAGTQHPVTVSLRPLYDPTAERIKV